MSDTETPIEPCTTETTKKFDVPRLNLGYRQTPEINELAEALSKAQGEIENPKFDCVNPHYQSKYASLQATLNVIRPALSKHGLSILQMPTSNATRAGVITKLMHKSGQWIESELTLHTDKPTAHGTGSALTYAKRYALWAFVGVAGEADDDGNAASAPAARDDDGKRETPKAPPKESLKQVLHRKMMHWSRCNGEDLPATAKLVFAGLGLPTEGKLTTAEIKRALAYVEMQIEQKIPFLDVFPPKEDVAA